MGASPHAWGGDFFGAESQSEGRTQLAGRPRWVCGLACARKKGGWGTCLSPGLYPTPNSRLIAAVSYSPTTPRSQYHQRKGGLASGFGKEPGVSRLP